jgi:peroxiredoxin
MKEDLVYLSIILLTAFTLFNFLYVNKKLKNLEIWVSDQDLVNNMTGEFYAYEADGSKVNFPEFSKKELLFIFFRTTCRSCIEEINLYTILAHKITSRGGKAYLISSEEIGKVSQFVIEKSLEISILFCKNEENDICSIYNNKGITPSFAFFGADKTLLYNDLVGSLAWSNLLSKYELDLLEGVR